MDQKLNHLFRLVLRNEPLVPAYLQPTIEHCISEGWLFPGGSGLYSFPSPLHKWCIQMLLPAPRNTNDDTLPSLDDFIHQVKLALPHRTTQSHLCHEFYRVASILLEPLGASIIYAELPPWQDHGAFYIPVLEWGIELICLGNSPITVPWAGEPFPRSGDFKQRVTIKDYVVLVFGSRELTLS